jgi:hypothetical protein
MAEYATKYVTKPNNGSLFATKVKNGAMSPDYWGDIVIDMKTVKPENGLLTIKLSGWKKESPNGNRYLSLAVNTFEKDGAKKAPAADDDEDLPF